MINRYTDHIHRLRISKGIHHNIRNIFFSVHAFLEKFPERKIRFISISCIRYSVRIDNSHPLKMINICNRTKNINYFLFFFFIQNLQFFCNSFQIILFIFDFFFYGKSILFCNIMNGILHLNPKFFTNPPAVKSNRKHDNNCSSNKNNISDSFYFFCLHISPVHYHLTRQISENSKKYLNILFILALTA